MLNSFVFNNINTNTNYLHYLISKNKPENIKILYAIILNHLVGAILNKYWPNLFAKMKIGLKIMIIKIIFWS